MKSAALFSIITSASAGVIVKRQTSFDFECNGQQFPVLADCDALIATFTDGTNTYTHPEGGNVLSINLGDESNCQVDITWSDQSYVVTENQVYQGIRGVRTTCLVAGTGGYANDIGDRYSIGIRNNPTYDPPEKREVKLIPMGRREVKRADGDTSFEYGVHTTNSKPPEMKHNIGSGLPGGSTWTWSSEQSVTDHVGFSASVSGGIEGVLSASLGTEISHDETWTSGQTSTITVNCEDNQYGQIYFQGYAEVWKGVLKPSGDPLTVTKPQANSDGSTAGFYSYDCIAK